MARYIDAEALYSKMKQLYKHYLQKSDFGADGAVSLCIEMLDDMPTADVVPKSEVAREIIDFIKGRIKAMEDHTPGENLDKAIGIVDWILSGVIDDLEKKYTEERE